MKIIIKDNAIIEKEWSGAAIASFICGIIAILLIPIIPAILFGHIALHNIKKNKMKGKVFAIIGLVSGYTLFAYVALIILILCINNNSEPNKKSTSNAINMYSREQALLSASNSTFPVRPKIVYNKNNYTYKMNKSNTPQTKNLHETLDDIQLAVNRENHGNFIYGVGTAALKYLVRESGIDEKMPKKTLGSEKLTKMIEDAGYTPNTDFSIAGRGGLIDYLWSTIE